MYYCVPPDSKYFGPYEHIKKRFDFKIKSKIEIVP